MNAALGIVVTTMLLLPSLSEAQVYRWEDRGTVHFTNAPERVPESYCSRVGPLPPPVVSEGSTPEPIAPKEEPVAVARALTRIPFALEHFTVTIDAREQIVTLSPK